LASHLLYVVVY